MPSISKENLDALIAQRDNATEIAELNLADARRGEERIRRFDTILDKVVRAAHGQSLEDSPNRGSYGESFTVGRYIDPGERRPKRDERQEQEIRNLNERILGLEARLAAVVAVATFAKVHKA